MDAVPRRVILHVGPHKTGTTALQDALTAHTGTLARHGIAFPKTGRTTHAHHDLVQAAGREIPGVLEDLAAEIAEEDTVLLSSEALATLHLSSLKRFAAALEDADVEVHYTLRPIGDLWPSHWREMIKHGLTDAFSAWVTRASSYDFSAFRAPPSPSAQLDRMVEVFGRAALRLKVYGAEDVGVGFARDALGLSPSEAEHFRSTRQNITPPDATLEVLRRASVEFTHEDPSLRRAVCYKMLDLLRVSPPDWLTFVNAAVDAAPRMVLTDQTPAVKAEADVTVARYGDLFDIGAWRRPAQVSVPLVSEISPEIDDAIRAFAQTAWQLP